MKLEFTSKREVVKKLYFKDVNYNQLFLTQSGHLCQKIDYDHYNVICNSDGGLCASGPHNAALGGRPSSLWEIDRIFNNITGIKITK